MQIYKKALIVEDNLILSILYENYLKDKVFETVGEIRDGETAVDLVKTYKPDIVIMDIMLEGSINGLEAAMQIRTFSDVPILFVTGNSDQKCYKKAIEISNTDFMVKPVSEHKLSRAIDNILKEKSSS